MIEHDDDFEPEVLPLAERLRAERPVPAAAFRGNLRRHLIASAAPRSLGMRIAAFATSGFGLLIISALGA